MNFHLKPFTHSIKKEITKEWESMADELSDKDISTVVKNDTDHALNSGMFTHAVVCDETGEFIALVGVVEADRINCHKVLDIHLNPSSNPEYHDEEIGLSNVSRDIAGTVIASLNKGFVSNDIKTVKLFGRGKTMKEYFASVVELFNQNPALGYSLYNQAGWLIINREDNYLGEPK